MTTPTDSPLPEDASPKKQRRAQGDRIASGFRVVSILTLLSRILGMVRDMTMAFAFGAGPIMDAFSVAFRLPNLTRRMFGEGALTTAFLPVFMRELEQEGEVSARRVATAVFYTLGLTLLGLVVVGEVMLAVLWFVVPASSDTRTLILLTAEMMPYLVLICLAAQLSAVLQSLERFFWPAMLPTILNIVWITTVLISVRTVEDDSVRIQLVAASVVLAGIVQWAVSMWATRQAGFHFVSGWRQAMPQVKEIVQTMVPIIFGLSITRLNVIGDSLLAYFLAAPSNAGHPPSPMIGDIAWPLEQGTASALFFAQRMYQFPVGVFGVALGVVLFPLLARHAERGDLEQVGRDQTLGLRLVIAIGIPASVGLMLLSDRIATLFFQRGAFTKEDAALTASCIFAYGLGVWANLGLIILNRGFYALGDRITPIRYGIYAVIINFTFNAILVWPFAGAGLAWATTLGSIGQVILVVRAYQRQIGLLHLGQVFRGGVRTVIATVAMAAACWGVMQFTPVTSGTLGRIASVGGPVTVAIGVYLATAKLIGLREPFILLFRKLESS